MGLAISTLNIRKQLLQVFERTWEYGLGIKASDVKPILITVFIVWPPFIAQANGITLGLRDGTAVTLRCTLVAA
jgi:hypothetical protein